MSENFLTPFTEGTKRLNRALKKAGKGLLDERTPSAWLAVSPFKAPTLIWGLLPFGKSPALYLVSLSQFMEHPSINGRSNKVISCSDGVDVTSEVEIKLRKIRSPISLQLSVSFQPSFIQPDCPVLTPMQYWWQYGKWTQQWELLKTDEGLSTRGSIPCKTQNQTPQMPTAKTETYAHSLSREWGVYCMSIRCSHVCRLWIHRVLVLFNSTFHLTTCLKWSFSPKARLGNQALSEVYKLRFFFFWETSICPLRYFFKKLIFGGKKLEWSFIKDSVYQMLYLFHRNDLGVAASCSAT